MAFNIYRVDVVFSLIRSATWISDVLRLIAPMVEPVWFLLYSCYFGCMCTHMYINIQFIYVLNRTFLLPILYIRIIFYCTSWYKWIYDIRRSYVALLVSFFSTFDLYIFLFKFWPIINRSEHDRIVEDSYCGGTPCRVVVCRSSLATDFCHVINFVVTPTQ